VSDNRVDIVEEVLLSLNGGSVIPTLGMYNTKYKRTIHRWRRYYTCTGTATTTILAAGLLEGIPSSLS
jgi:hypothetical protein